MQGFAPKLTRANESTSLDPLVFAGGFVNRLHGGHARGGAGVLVISALSSAGFFCQIVRHETLKSLIQTRDTRSVRVFLIGVELKSRTAAAVRESLAELEELATTAGTLIVGEGVQKMAAPVAATYIGPGKAEEFAALCKERRRGHRHLRRRAVARADAQPGKNLSAAKSWIAPR